MFVQRSGKATAVTGKEEHIMRFVPKPVSELLVKYLTLIRPLEVVAASVAYGQSTAANYQTYFYCRYGGRMTADEIRDVFLRRMRRLVKSANQVYVCAWFDY